jgi:hypothetical protein
MPVGEAKKPVARIQLPVRKVQEGVVRNGPGEDVRPSEESGGADTSGHGDGGESGSHSARGVHLLMSKSRPPVKRDPLAVPMVGLLLAFSVISLIVQLLIAFS